MEEHRVCVTPRVPEVHGPGLIAMRWRTRSSSSPISLDVSRQELRIINNALSEGLDRVDDRLFPTLMGATKEEVEVLLGDFRELREDLPS